MPPAVTPQYVAPVFFTDKAKELNDKFYITLNNLVAAYPNAKYRSDQAALQTDYTNFMNEMHDLQSEYFLYRNDVLVASDTLSKKGQDLDREINTLNTQIQATKVKIDNLKNSGYSAEGMLDDKKLTRNQVFFGNMVLFLILSISAYMFYKKVLSPNGIAKVAAPVKAKAAAAAAPAKAAPAKAAPAPAKAAPAPAKAAPAPAKAAAAAPEK
jgi:hypothetical protein